MTYKILGTHWWTPSMPGKLPHEEGAAPAPVVCAVAIESGDGWKAYMSLVDPLLDEDEGAQQAAGFGVHLSKFEALALFPDLPADRLWE